MTSIECKVVNSIETGDHIIFIGEAVNVKRRKSGKKIIQDENGELKGL